MPSAIPAAGTIPWRIRDGALHGYDLVTRQFMPLVCPLERRQAG